MLFCCQPKQNRCQALLLLKSVAMSLSLEYMPSEAVVWGSEALAWVKGGMVPSFILTDS